LIDLLVKTGDISLWLCHHDRIIIVVIISIIKNLLHHLLLNIDKACSAKLLKYAA